MTFLANQTTALFVNVAQMGLSNHTHLQSQSEGVTDVSDLGEFYDANWDQFASNCRRPGQIPDPNNQANCIYQQQQPVAIPVRSLHCLKVASVAIRHYVATACPLLAAIVRWDTVLLDFEEQCKGTNEASKTDAPSVPNLTNMTSVPKVGRIIQSSFDSSLWRRWQNCSLLTHPHVLVEVIVPDLAYGQPHSVEYDLIYDGMTYHRPINM